MMNYKKSKKIAVPSQNVEVDPTEFLQEIRKKLEELEEC